MSADGTVLPNWELLNQEREQVILRLRHLHEMLKSTIDPDSDDGASDLEEQDNIMALIPDLNSKLADIDRALQRVEQGTYGFCERCGKPIDPARLEIMPEATFCVQCKTIIERQNRLRANASS